MSLFCFFSFSSAVAASNKGNHKEDLAIKKDANGVRIPVPTTLQIGDKTTTVEDAQFELATQNVMRAIGSDYVSKEQLTQRTKKGSKLPQGIRCVDTGKVDGAKMKIYNVEYLTRKLGGGSTFRYEVPVTTPKGESTTIPDRTAEPIVKATLYPIIDGNGFMRPDAQIKFQAIADFTATGKYAGEEGKEGEDILGKESPAVSGKSIFTFCDGLAKMYADKKLGLKAPADGEYQLKRIEVGDKVKEDPDSDAYPIMIYNKLKLVF